jgi:hypothetical protein
VSRERNNHAQRLRTAVEVLPRHTREAMLRGIDGNPIIVGAYTDNDGGICPMLAAHRNGGRTSFASFARAWDAFTNAPKRPRRASRREIRALRTYLEMSLLTEDTAGASLTEIAASIREQRRDAPAPEPRPSISIRRLKPKVPRLRRAPRYDVFEATAAAEAELRADQLRESHPAG